jgi:hypothetical protein
MASVVEETEWIGARYTSPHPVQDGDSVFHADVFLWMELPRGVLLVVRASDPRTPVTLAESLEEAMQRPGEGAPRRPSWIRVAGERDAVELRRTAGGIPIVVAPVPELDAVFEELNAATAPEPSYLGHGTIAPQLVGALFQAADLLFRTAPWKRLSDRQILRVDIPSLGIDGACLSIIGAAGESFGLLLFSSLEDYDSFIEAASGAHPEEPPAVPGKGPVALRSLSFNAGDDLPESLLREIDEHRWLVAQPHAYPTFFCLGKGHTPRRVTESDVRITTAVTRAFVAFYLRHPNLFDSDDLTPVRLTSEEDGLQITLTAPYTMSAADRPKAMQRVGRNDPCPCGSGKKYKKCHLEADEAQARTSAFDLESILQMDFRIVRAMSRFASSRFGPGWIDVDLDEEERDSLELILPWATWTAEAEGNSVADAYLEQHGSRLSAEEREWFTAQRTAYPSVLEVIAAEPGRIDVRDLLTGEMHRVREELASRTVEAGDTLLARVIEHRGVSYFAGMHSRSVLTSTAAHVVDLLRAKLGLPDSPIPVERLRDLETGWFLVDRWADAVDDEDEHLVAEKQPDRPKTLRVDMNELELAFENDAFTSYLDTDTGEIVVVPGDAYEAVMGDEEYEETEAALELIEDNPGRFLLLQSGADIRPSIDDARAFARSVEDEAFRRRLEAALDQRRGAFRSFLDVVHQESGEIERWNHVSRQRVRDNIAASLAVRGIKLLYDPLPPFQPRDDARRHLLAGAAAFVKRVKQIKGVTRIALIGSITTPKRSPNNINILLTIASEDIVPDIAAAGRKLMGHAQQLNRGADIFLADPTGRYLGRTCPWRDCGPGIRSRCQAQHCGGHLYDDLRVLTLKHDTITTPPIEIWPKVVVRGDVPKDVLEAFGIEG